MVMKLMWNGYRIVVGWFIIGMDLVLCRLGDHGLSHGFIYYGDVNIPIDVFTKTYKVYC